MVVLAGVEAVDVEVLDAVLLHALVAVRVVPCPALAERNEQQVIAVDSKVRMAKAALVLFSNHRRHPSWWGV